MFLKSFAIASLAVCSSLSSVSFADSSNQDVFAQVFTNWIAVVKDGVSAKECALEVANTTGYSVLNSFETIGILVIETPSTDGSGLAQVSCVEAYELEGQMSVSQN